MQIPAILFGSYREVKLRCQRLIKQMAKGSTWQELFSDCEMLDTNEHLDLDKTVGLLVLDGPSPTINAYGSQFHVYVLHAQILEACQKDVIPESFEEAAFEASLTTAWGTLGLLSARNMSWFSRPVRLYSSEEEWRSKRFEPMLDACLQHWDVLYAEGKRYVGPISTPRNLWDLKGSLSYILANMNIPIEVLNSALPSGGLPEIIAIVRASKPLSP